MNNEEQMSLILFIPTNDNNINYEFDHNLIIIVAVYIKCDEVEETI